MNSFNRRLIVLTGIDGSGKTTQSVLLYNFLKDKNINVGLIHYEMSFLFHKILWLMIFFRRKLMGIRNTNNDLINDKASIVRTKKLIERFFIFWLYLLDTIFFYKLRFRKALSRYELIILDRYPIIDGISYLWFHGLNPYFVSRFYLKAFPRPSIVLCLKTSPEVAFGRRKDMGLIRLKIYDMLLKTILDRIITRHYDVNVIYIDAHYPIEQVHRQIVKELQITIDI